MALIHNHFHMINHLIAAEADYSLLKELQYYKSPVLLVVEEIGYLSASYYINVDKTT